MNRQDRAFTMLACMGIAFFLSVTLAALVLVSIYTVR